MSDIRGHGRTGSGDEPSLDAIAPGTTAPRQAWHDYSEAVWQELAAAQLTRVALRSGDNAGTAAGMDG